MDLGITVDVHGSLFDGRAEMIIADYCDHIEQVLGDTSVSWIRAYLPTQYQYLRNPKSLGYHGSKTHFIPGLYEAAIHTVQTTDAVLVHDTPVVYGPWLEGVGSRNATTRFKGYHTFRIISQQLDLAATDIATAELPRYIGEINA